MSDRFSPQAGGPWSRSNGGPPQRLGSVPITDVGDPRRRRQPDPKARREAEARLPRSTRFRMEREASWQELDEVTAKLQRYGPKHLTTAELMSLPRLYRSTLSALTVARGFSLDRNLRVYLESLALRAFLVLHTSSRTIGHSGGGLIGRTAADIRAHGGLFLLSALCMLIGAMAGFVAVQLDPVWFYSFVPDGLANGRGPHQTPEAMYQSLYATPSAEDQLSLFAGFLFSHNGMIAILSFGLGAAFGVPTLVLLIYNGISIGAMIAVFADAGLGADFLAWLAVHGTTELTAIVLSGAGGLILAQALIFAKRQRRTDSLSAAAGPAVRFLIAAVFMLFVAALLEGFVRQLVNDLSTRVLIGVVMMIVWLAVVLLAGRVRRAMPQADMPTENRAKA